MKANVGILAKAIALFREQPQPPVVHDAPKPRDLDETFFDEKAQERVGKVISQSTKRD